MSATSDRLERALWPRRLRRRSSLLAWCATAVSTYLRISSSRAPTADARARAASRPMRSRRCPRSRRRRTPGRTRGESSAGRPRSSSKRRPERSRHAGAPSEEAPERREEAGALIRNSRRSESRRAHSRPPTVNLPLPLYTPTERSYEGAMARAPVLVRKWRNVRPEDLRNLRRSAVPQVRLTLISQPPPRPANGWRRSNPPSARTRNNAGEAPGRGRDRSAPRMAP